MANTPSGKEPTGENRSGGSQEPSQAPSTGGRKRRRWLRVVLVAMTLLGLIVVAAPWLVSTSMVSGLLVGVANDTIRGQLRLERLSLTWFGPTSVDALDVRDDQDRAVLAVRRVQVASGVWQLLTDRASFGEVLIDAPRVVLHLNDDNEVSLAEAFQTVAAKSASSGDSAAGPMTIPRGFVKITGGTVEVSRDGARSYETGDLNAELEIGESSKLSGTLALRLPGGSNLTGRASVSDLFTDGAIDVARASGTLKLGVDQPADIGPLAEILLRRDGLEGEALLSLDARIEPGDLSADFVASMAKFQTKDRKDGKASPLDGHVTGKMALKDNQLSGTLDLSGTPGTARVDLMYQVDARLPDLDAEKITAVLFGGGTLSLPEFSMTVDSDIDLSAVERSVPGLLPLPEGSSLVSGNAKVTSLALTGGDVPTVRGSVRLANLSTKNATGTTALDPLSLDLDIKLQPNVGVQIERADFASKFASVRASGSAAELRAHFDSNLALLRSELGQIVDLGGLNVTGQVGGTITVARVDDDNLNTSLELTADKIRHTQGDKIVELERTVVTQKGSITLMDGDLAQLSVSEMSIDVDEQLVAAGSGRFDFKSKALSGSLNVREADLDFIAKRAEAFGITGLAGFTGNALGEVTVEQSSATGPLRFGGRLVGQRLATEGRSILENDTTLTWSDGAFDQASGDLSLETAQWQSDLGDVRISGIRVAGDTRRGTIKGSIDLARLMGAVGALSKQEKPSEVRGQLTLDANVSHSDAGIELAGTGDIAGLEVGTAAQTYREERVAFTCNAVIDPESRRAVLGVNRITSKALTAEVSGTIDAYDTEMLASLQGRYDASWTELTALLHEFVPSTANMVVMSGKSQSEFKISGPLQTAGASPSFVGVTAGGGMTWETAQVAGIDLGGATLTPELSGGVLRLQPTRIKATQGEIQLAGSVDLRSPEPTILMPGSNHLLKGIVITPELTQELLSRVNPIFYHVAATSGIVDLTVTDLVFPLGKESYDIAGGTGRLELENMKVEPSGFFKQLLVMSGNDMRGEMIAVGVRGLNFQVKNGRILYKDFTLEFPNEFDLVFFGSVGLDETLDLTVSMPLNAGVLKSLGVSGSAASYASKLLGQRVDVPLVGTRENPVLDFKSIDTEALLGDVLKESAAESVGGLLKGLLKEK